MTQITTYAMLFSLMSCLLDVVIIVLLFGFTKSRSDESIKTALRMMVLLFVVGAVISVEQSYGQEDIPLEIDVPVEDDQPILLDPSLMQRASIAIIQDILGEEAAVQAGHLLFLEGNYSMGNWSLNNTTIG